MAFVDGVYVVIFPESAERLRERAAGVRIRIHEGKTQVWDSGGERLEFFDVLERIAQGFRWCTLSPSAKDDPILPEVLDLQSAWALFPHCPVPCAPLSASSSPTLSLRVCAVVVVFWIPLATTTQRVREQGCWADGDSRSRVQPPEFAGKLDVA